MTKANIVIRQALLSDCYDIWSLAHNEGYRITERYIVNNIDKIYVLEFEKRILGAVCGKTDTVSGDIEWAAIHPMYPEKSLVTAMINGISGVFFKRNPQKSRELRGIPLLKQLFIKIPAYLKHRGAANGISGKQEF